MRVLDLRVAAIAASIFLFFATAASGQVESNQASGAILGQVRFESGLAAPAGIVIRLENRESGALAETVSDTSGRFRFSALLPGEYVAAVSSSDYQTTAQTVEVQPATSVPVLFDLHSTGKSANRALPAGAEAEISVAQLSIPEKARKELGKGLELLNEKHEPAKSIPYFERVLRRYPQFAAAALFLGIARLQTHNWDEAQTNLQRALQLDHRLTPAYVALGALYNEQGKYEQAEPLLAQALALDSSSAMIHYEMGRTYCGLARWGEAETEARSALELQSDLAEAHVLAGNILLRQGKANLALAQFRDYLRLAPAGPMAGPAQQVIARIEQRTHSASPANPAAVAPSR